MRKQATTTNVPDVAVSAAPRNDLEIESYLAAVSGDASATHDSTLREILTNAIAASDEQLLMVPPPYSETEDPNRFAISSPSADTVFLIGTVDESSQRANATYLRIIAYIRNSVPQGLQDDFERALTLGHIQSFDGQLIARDVQGPVGFAKALIRAFCPHVALQAHHFDVEDFAARR